MLTVSGGALLCCSVVDMPCVTSLAGDEQWWLGAKYKPRILAGKRHEMDSSGRGLLCSTQGV
jgi:hypothetical protein